LNKNISEILKFFAQLAKKTSAFSNQNSKFKEFIMSEEEEKNYRWQGILLQEF